MYVQHKIAENSEQFNRWIENGATIYVCGDESKMAKDVHQAIKNVLIKEQNLSETDAEEYLKQMKRDKRYQKRRVLIEGTGDTWLIQIIIFRKN